jgi:hypothetical protein
MLLRRMNQNFDHAAPALALTDLIILSYQSWLVTCAQRLLGFCTALTLLRVAL